MCDICDHINRKEIEAALYDSGPGNSIKELSKRYTVKAAKLLAHKENHMVDCSNELVQMVTEEYNKKMKETGVTKALTSIEVLDLVIAKAPELLKNATMNDVLRAIKLKSELTGTITQKQEIKLEWLTNIPEDEKK